MGLEPRANQRRRTGVLWNLEFWRVPQLAEKLRADHFLASVGAILKRLQGEERCWRLGEEVMVERVLDFLGPRGLICISPCVRIGRLAAGVGVGERWHDEGSVLNF